MRRKCIFGGGPCWGARWLIDKRLIFFERVVSWGNIVGGLPRLCGEIGPLGGGLLVVPHDKVVKLVEMLFGHRIITTN